MGLFAFVYSFFVYHVFFTFKCKIVCRQSDVKFLLRKLLWLLTKTQMKVIYAQLDLYLGM